MNSSQALHPPKNNKILVHLIKKSFFFNSDMQPCHFYIGASPPPPPLPTASEINMSDSQLKFTEYTDNSDKTKFAKQRRTLAIHLQATHQSPCASCYLIFFFLAFGSWLFEIKFP